VDADLARLAATLAQGGAVAVILILLVAITALLRRWVKVPDAEYVPREMYEQKAKEAAEWKAIALPAAETIKEQADQLAKLTDVIEIFSRNLGSRKR